MKGKNPLGYTWANLIKNLMYAVGMIVGLLGACLAQAKEGEVSTLEVLARVEAHEFHPLNDDNTFTNDRTLGQHGIADLKDRDWRVRLLAVGALVRLGMT